MAEGGEEFVRLREYFADRERNNARLSNLEMEQATLRTALMHMPEKFDKLVDKIDSLRKPESDTQLSLVLHRAMDLFERGNKTATPSFVTAAAMIAAAIGGGWLAHFLAGTIK